MKKLKSYFTTYEKIWFLSVCTLAILFAFLFPEEDINGINGKTITILYVVDVFSNVLCELLIAKQSRWNFLVSLFFVEGTEILICLLLKYRFATMLVTIMFWIPVDIISFITWSKHKDEEEKYLTKVKKLSRKSEILIIFVIIIYTITVGSILVFITDGISVTTLFKGNRDIEVICLYIDAFVSAAAICNGIFILFRIEEQWIAWYISTIGETIINILSGQFILLILKAGYLTNTTYGYIKWDRYIKKHKEEVLLK